MPLLASTMLRENHTIWTKHIQPRTQGNYSSINLATYHTLPEIRRHTKLRPTYLLRERLRHRLGPDLEDAEF